MLSLARACPKLTKLEWWRPDSEYEWDSDEEEANRAEINELIVGRGGEFDVY